MLLPQVGMWDAAVDYLRLTYKKDKGSYDVANQYARAAIGIASRIAPSGTKSELWRWMGYHGERIYNVAWGEHDAGFIFQASGLAAREAAMLVLPYTHCPRIDIQATFWFTTDDEGLASRVASVANHFRSGKRGRKVSTRLISGFGQGDTTYIGTRGKKSKFLRCYDKWRESKLEEGYRYAWRYECELTDEHAGLCYGSIQDLPNRSEAVLSLVAGYYSERGIALPQTGSSVCVRPESLPKDSSSDERRLLWLKNQVGPTVAKLMARGVSREAVLSALGLDDKSA